MTWLVDADVKEPVIETGVNASGGTESVININGQAYRLHTFTSTDELLVFSGGMVEVLAVGAGGSGGVVPSSGDLIFGIGGAGGGGGGGVVNCNLEVFGGGGFLGEYDIAVGTSSLGSSGGDSAIVSSGVDQVRAKGGGKGGDITGDGLSASAGQNGGSSGGGAFLATAAPASTSAGDRVFGQGTNGSDAFQNGNNGTSGGGGGAATPARTAELNVPADGGNGFGSTMTGALLYYGGGGGGGTGNTTSPFGSSVSIAGSGGLGGGGRGADQDNASTAGANGFGSGGGGGGAFQDGATYINFVASAGGSGIVIIRYPIEV